MVNDPYKILGVARGASDDEIRRAYRRLAKEKHPDLNPGEKAAESFKKISTAYALLSDPDKRRAYDMGEIDANGEPRGFQSAHGAARGGAGGFGGFHGRAGGADPGFGDIFSDLFGGRAGAGMGMGGRGGGFARRGQDVRYTLELDFIEAVKGARKRVTLPEGGVLDLNVPAGVNDGQSLRLKGKGTAGIGGGPAGDALVEIKVRAHPQFKRLGNDILFDLPITIDEAILGAKIEVPTVDGRVQVTIPKATNSGQVMRLKGKGVKPKGAVKAGDQLVTVRIVMPDKIDDQLAYFMSEWRLKNAYNPGRK